MTRSDKAQTDFDRGTTGDQVPPLQAVAPPLEAEITAAGSSPAATLDVPGITPPQDGAATTTPATAGPSRTAMRNAEARERRRSVWAPAGLILLGLGAVVMVLRR